MHHSYICKTAFIAWEELSNQMINNKVRLGTLGSVLLG